MTKMATTLLLRSSLAVLALWSPSGALAQAGPVEGNVPPREDGVTSEEEEPRTVADSAGQDGEEVIVTGSRIGRTNLTSTSPVAILGRDDIVLDRALNSEDVVNELPQLTGSFGAVSNGADARGAATLDLRGLGQNRTLVLIDGTRAVPFGFRNSVDINSIPAPLIQRVEVLTGGASAIYGADAVAGVVNFILRDDFEGAEASAIYNVSERGDGINYGANLTVGTSLGGRGNVSAYVGYSERKGLRKGDRAFASPERNDLGIITTRPGGGTFTRTDNASVFTVGGAASPRLSFTDAGALTATAQVGEFSAVESLIQPLQRLTGAAFFNLDVTDAVEVYGRATAVYSETTDRLPPANAAVQVLVGRDNPFLTPALRTALEGSFNRTRAGALGGTDAVLLSASRSFTELGNRGFDTERTAFQVQAGVRGDLFANVRWDAYAQYGRTDDETEILGEGILARISQAANATVNASGQAVCVDPSGGCVPVNLFGPGAITPQAAAFIAQPLSQARDRDQLVVAAGIAGDSGGLFELPAGPVDFAVGVEYREETGDVSFDSAIQNGLTINQGRRPNFGGGFDVKEVFGEIRVPILRDVPFFQRLDAEAAYRLSDYSQTGTVDAYKLGANWALADALRIRGAYQTVVRAPNIGELFGAPGSVPLQGRAVDPCANPATSGASVEVCRATGAPAAPFTQDLTGALFLFGGNADLEAEEGRTYTIGAVLTPPFLRGVSLTADYYNIRIDNAIGAVLPQATLDTCYVITQDAANPFCARIARGPNGQLTAVDSSDVNVALLQVEGIDIGARAGLDLPGGVAFERLNLDYAGDVVLGQKQRNGAAAQTVECAGRFGGTCGLETRRALPKYRHRVTAALAGEGLTVRTTWRMLGSVRDDSPSAFTVERIGSQHYIDLAAAYDVGENLSLVFGVENLFDEDPPIVGTNQADANTFPASYDVIGRRFGVSVTVRN